MQSSDAYHATYSKETGAIGFLSSSPLEACRAMKGEMGRELAGDFPMGFCSVGIHRHRICSETYTMETVEKIGQWSDTHDCEAELVQTDSTKRINSWEYAEGRSRLGTQRKAC